MVLAAAASTPMVSPSHIPTACSSGRASWGVYAYGIACTYPHGLLLGTRTKDMLFVTFLVFLPFWFLPKPIALWAYGV